MAFLFKLETESGEPAEPAELQTAVPNWRAGDTVRPLASRSGPTRRDRRNELLRDRSRRVFAPPFAQGRPTSSRSTALSAARNASSAAADAP